MKGKFVKIISIILWVIILITILKIKDRFWLGFITGAYIALTIAGLIYEIRRMEKEPKTKVIPTETPDEYIKRHAQKIEEFNRKHPEKVKELQKIIEKAERGETGFKTKT